MTSRDVFAVGTIGLSLIAGGHCGSLRCVEVNGAGRAAFDLSVQQLPLMARALPLSYHVCAASESAPEWLSDADVIIVDPPRKGLETALIETLVNTASGVRSQAGARRLIYLSCGFTSLLRDLDALTSGQRWEISHAQAFVFFPGTDSLETLVVLDEVT